MTESIRDIRAVVSGDSVESVYLPAARSALEHFSVEAERIELVSHSENVTFRVSVRGCDDDYVLRLHRPGYSAIEELESEKVWVSALAQTGVTVPMSLKTRNGRHFVLIDIPEIGEQRYAGMISWHDGVTLGTFLEDCTEESVRQRVFYRFGEILALFHNQSSRWQLPGGFVRRRLDLDGLLGDSPFWGEFWQHPALTDEEQAVLLEEKARARRELAAYGEHPENFSLIHTDFTPDNLIYTGEDLVAIDFDDAAFGWHMYDIAAALIECRYEKDYVSLEVAFLDGYRAHRALAPEDLDMLPTFLLVRGMAIIGWYQQRPEHVGEQYFEDVRRWVLDECRNRQSGN